MSSPVPPTLVSDPGRPKRSGEGAMQEIPPKRQRHGLEPKAESCARPARLYDPHDTQPVSVTASQLCQRCEEIDLERWLSESYAAKSIGFLDSFNSPRCLLCDTVQHFVTLHWGSELPPGIDEHQPEVYIRGRRWYSFRDSEGLMQPVYRILLAIDQRSTDSQWMMLNVMDRPPGRTNVSILTELELDPGRLKDPASVPSLRRSLASCVDVELLKDWLQECRGHNRCNDHRKLQQSNMVQLFANGFRLIDVDEGKLVEKTQPCEYVALSYVWGQLEPPPLRTNKENVYALSQPSSLISLREGRSVTKQVPRTIADAITLCRSLGYRYLWVDSLCIVQDDEIETQHLIHRMDRVYENASLTVVALSGVDAAAGLAGITPRIHDDNDGLQRFFHKGYGTDCLAIGRISMEEHIRSSYWNMRGWTYQEQLFSARKLYFSCNEVFYDCVSDTWREGYRFEGERFGHDFEIRESGPQQYRNLFLRSSLFEKLPPSFEVQGEEFLGILSTYTRRDLTEPGDILNAFSGIYHRLDGDAGYPAPDITALQGHHRRHFFSSLLWVTLSDHHERRSRVNGTRTSTWSWVAFSAPVEFRVISHTSFPKSFEIQPTPELSMVDEFRLYFQNSDNHDVNQIRIPNSPLCRRWSKIAPYSHILTDQLLRLFSDKDYEALPAPSSVSAGVLEFLGLYVPKPTAASSRWFKTKCGEWLLSFEGKSVRGVLGAPNTVLIAKFDPGEDSTDGFVLLTRNGGFVGLCVRKMGEYFERIGLVILTSFPNDWQTIAAEGLLDLYWKHILLR